MLIHNYLDVFTFAMCAPDTSTSALQSDAEKGGKSKSLAKAFKRTPKATCMIRRNTSFLSLCSDRQVWTGESYISIKGSTASCCFGQPSWAAVLFHRRSSEQCEVSYQAPPGRRAAIQ